jgi:hypothetical protein
VGAGEEMNQALYAHMNNKKQNKTKQKNSCSARHQWLTLVILTTWEAKIGRIAVQGHPGSQSLQDPISTNQ